MYESWLLFAFDQPGNDDPLLGRLKDYELSSTFKDPNKRRKWYCWVEGGQFPTLGFEEEDECIRFFNKFLPNRKSASPSAPVKLMYSSLPIRELSMFHNKEFSHKGLSVLCESLFVLGPSGDLNPYYRRFLRFKYTPYDPQSNLRATTRVETRVKEEQKKSKYFLINEPERIKIDAVDKVNSLFELSDSPSDLLLLPPWRTDYPESSYFNKEYLAVRRSLYSTIWESETPEELPLGILANRLCDDPLYRDLLVEGAHFDIEKANGAKNKIACHLNDTEDALSLWRRHYFSKTRVFKGTDWGEGIMDGIIQDAHLPFAGIELGYSEGHHATSWEIPRLRQFHNQTGSTADGIFKTMDFLGSEALEGPKHTLYKRKVLLPAKRQDAPPDNDLVAQNFVAHFGRCPWSEETEYRGLIVRWRELLVEILKEYETNGKVRNTMEWLLDKDGIWQLQGIKTWKEDGIWFHDPIRSHDEVLMIRLLLPVSEIVSAYGSNVLDNPYTRLNYDCILG